MIAVYLDSSENSLSVGISNEEKIIDRVSYEVWQTQSEKMIPELDKLLDKYHYTKEDINKVYVASGPGSYTGIRISLTIGKVMATVLGCDLYLVSSLQVLKDDDKPSICLLNARSQRSYIGVYQNDKVLLKDQIMSNDEVLSYINEHREFVVCGNTKYLGIEGKKTDLVKQMFSLKDKLVKESDPLASKPVYLKEEYAVPQH